ncbi:MAG: EAL domain-containing protein [Labilithrix sp.]|nr:EAL domain-containing protein [Labilithrix sp.]
MPDGRRDAPPATAADVHALLAEPSRIALVAQPIVDVRRAVVVGYESLARFSLGRPTPPDQVFAAATRAGLGAELEAAVIGRALELASAKPPNCFLTINVDPLHLVSPLVDATIDAHDSLAGIFFELTEHHSVEDLDALRRALARLRKRGALIAIDDAGAGYSGLKQIIELEPQLIKVDRALVSDVHASEAKRALIQMLGELSGRLDAWLLAEGIETPEELNALGQLGVPLAQGYLLGRPAPPWSPLDPKLEQMVRRLPRPRALAAETIDGVVEPCKVCREDADWPDAPGICVRVDGTSRPVAMRVRGDDGDRTRRLEELLRVKRTSLLREVALRASTRPERLRWDPLVCIDERGELAGVVPMQRLVCALVSADEDAGGEPESDLPIARLEPSPVCH